MDNSNINKTYSRDAIARVTAEISKLRGTVLILSTALVMVTLISIWEMTHRVYPLLIPGYSDKPVYISENDAPASSYRLTAEYITYLTQTYSEQDYLGRHEYALKYFAPGAGDLYEKFFTDEFRNIIDKDRISANFEPEEFKVNMNSKSVIIDGYITLYKDGVEDVPRKMIVEVDFSDDPYQVKVVKIDAKMEE